MSARAELADEVRAEALAYVDAVVARAEGVGDAGGSDAARADGRRPLVTHLVPSSVKRAFVRLLIYVLRHPFEHLAHPLRTQLEEEIGQARGMAQAAVRRAEHNAAEVRRLRAELSRQRSAN
jgi:hypothetical protein